MHLKSPIQQLFEQLSELLHQLPDDAYCRPIGLLSGATIGQHVRHVIECFQELEKGYPEGHVNYDHRKRDRRLETNQQFAILQMKAVTSALRNADKPLEIHAEFDEGLQVTLSSNYYRELYHNLDHTIHHMAMIRIGVLLESNIMLPVEFGVAYATNRFRTNNSINKN